MRFLFAAVLAFWFVLATVPGSKAEWRGGDTFSQAVPESGATSLNGTVYLLSGSSGTGFKRFFEAYNIVEDGWRPLTPIPVDRTQFSVAAGSGQIVVTGGRVAGTSEATKSSWMFSTAKSYWTQITSMPGRRYEHMTAIIGNFLYVFGGAGDDTDKIYRYNLGSGEWSILPGTMPVTLSQAGIAVAGSDIIIAGGMTATGQASREIHVFNVQSLNWRRLPSLPFGLIAPAVGVLSDGVHVVGGYSNEPQKTYDLHFLLSDKARKWQKKQSLPEARHHAGYAVLNDRLIIMGGAVGSGFFAPFTATDTVYIFKP
ncbi:MAG: hypothetical protein DBW69_02745 [PS1 clade bacterium]|uniref:Galactose oxidase n=1 Tax=PS1 clade bacterium TaxID=2175152 RepID=A0A368E2A6_9PROT|nr:MAG: hypothetical protein DBW69_02745 [PS1 clade bacterium]